MQKKYAKIAVLTLLISMFLLTRPVPAQAGEWGGDMAAAIWTKAVNDMTKAIQDSILANAKMAAVRVIQNRMSSLFKSSSGSNASGLSGMIISNFQSFIFSTASNTANNVTNDFFDILNAGATTATKQYVLNPAQKALAEGAFSQLPNLQDYCPGGDPSKAFSPGTVNNWLCWTKAAQPQNDLASIYLRAQALKQAQLQATITAQTAEAIAGQGVASKKTTSPGPADRTMTASNGKQVSVPARSDYKGSTESITMTGAMIGSLQNRINQMGIDMVAYAKSLPEVVTNMVTTTMTQMINEKISETFSKIQ